MRRRAERGLLIGISGATRLVGLIGDPVAHSLSPAIHNAAFEALGLDMVYVPLPVKAEHVGAAVQGLRALGFRGANVTVPHKAAVAPHLDRLEGDAAALGAVNTIVCEESGAAEGEERVAAGGEQRAPAAREQRALVGHNTDVDGVRRALQEACGDSLRGERALLLGAGGAARAVALALARFAMTVTVVNIVPQEAAQLVAIVTAAVPGAAFDVAPWEALGPDLVASQRLLVNATSLGMAGTGKVPAALADNVFAGHVVFDVVYTSSGTEFLARSRERGAKTVAGLEMLLWQAASAFELWSGRPAPLKVMRDAATRQRREQ